MGDAAQGNKPRAHGDVLGAGKEDKEIGKQEDAALIIYLTKRQGEYLDKRLMEICSRENAQEEGENKCGGTGRIPLIEKFGNV